MTAGLLWLALVGCGAEDSATTTVAEVQPVQAEVAEPVLEAPAATAVDVTALKTALEAGAPIVDVRTRAEYDSGHVPEALHIPLNELERRVEELQPFKDAPLYVICQSGGRSAMATNWLNQREFSAVNVVGGTTAWKAAGHPVAP